MLLGTLLYVAAYTSVFALTYALARPLHADNSFSFIAVGPWVAVAVVTWATWAYHAWARTRDLRGDGTIRGAAAWVSRLYVYGAALLGLTSLLSATTGLIGVAFEAATNAPSTANPANLFSPTGPTGTAAWWVIPVLTGVVNLVIWGWIWSGHSLYAARLRRRADEQGSLERSSRVRLAFFVGIVAVTAGQVALAFAVGLGAAIGIVVRSPTALDTAVAWRSAIEPPVGAAFLIVAWWAYRRLGAREQVALEGGSRWRAIRPMDYLTALIGLGFLVTGLTSLVTVLVGHAAGEVYPILGGDWWRLEAAGDIGVAVVGLPFWMWPWLAARRRIAIDRPAEVRSSSRRFYLFLVAGAAVIAAAGALVLVASQVARVALGLDSSGFGRAVRDPLVYLAAAAIVLVFHGLVLRRDLALGSGEEVAAAEAGPEVAAGMAQPAGREVVIAGPVGSEEHLRAWLAVALPAGYSVTVRSVGETPGS